MYKVNLTYYITYRRIRGFVPCSLRQQRVLIFMDPNDLVLMSSASYMKSVWLKYIVSFFSIFRTVRRGNIYTDQVVHCALNQQLIANTFSLC